MASYILFTSRQCPICIHHHLFKLISMDGCFCPASVVANNCGHTYKIIYLKIHSWKWIAGVKASTLVILLFVLPNFSPWDLSLSFELPPQNTCKLAYSDLFKKAVKLLEAFADKKKKNIILVFFYYFNYESSWMYAICVSSKVFVYDSSPLFIFSLPHPLHSLSPLVCSLMWLSPASFTANITVLLQILSSLTERSSLLPNHHPGCTITIIIDLSNSGNRKWPEELS